jgi:hypothetical protein
MSPFHALLLALGALGASAVVVALLVRPFARSLGFR